MDLAYGDFQLWYVLYFVDKATHPHKRNALVDIISHMRAAPLDDNVLLKKNDQLFRWWYHQPTNQPKNNLGCGPAKRGH